ncbi:MAG: hypothetical protein U0800_17850 [Isosphaeraceae bacterium]
MPNLGRPRSDRRARRGARFQALESLESRNLMAYTGLGFSLPDLLVSGYAGPGAAYGGPLTVTAQVRNIGASSFVEPLNLAPGATSSADAGPFNVGVYMSKGPKFNKSAIRIGTIAFDQGLDQNDLATKSVTIPALPNRPAGFPAAGKDIYITLVADSEQQVREQDKSNNVSTSVPVKMAPGLPQLQAIGLDVPTTMKPGDWIKPSILIANYGTTQTANQAPVTVELVYSSDGTFFDGNPPIATFTIDNILPVSQAPTQNLVLGDANLDIPANVRKVDLPNAVQLPYAAKSYYIGLRVDPNEQIQQISDLRGPRSPYLEQIRQVAPSANGLPQAGVVQAPASLTANLFPTPPYGPVTTNNVYPVFNPNLYYAAANQPRNHYARIRAKHRNLAMQIRTPDRGRAGGGWNADRPMPIRLQESPGPTTHRSRAVALSSSRPTATPPLARVPDESRTDPAGSSHQGRCPFRVAWDSGRSRASSPLPRGARQIPNRSWMAVLAMTSFMAMATGPAGPKTRPSPIGSICNFRSRGRLGRGHAGNPARPRRLQVHPGRKKLPAPPANNGDQAGRDPARLLLRTPIAITPFSITIKEPGCRRGPTAGASP